MRSRNTFADRTVNSADGQSKERLQRRNVEVAGDRYPPIDPGLDSELRGRFREENLALADWLGRDLTGWLRP